MGALMMIQRPSGLAEGQAPAPLQLLVSDEYGVIALRHEIRQMARAIGLPPTQQARITAAASAISKALLNHNMTVQFLLQPTKQGTRVGLEISCAPPGVYGPRGEAELDELLNMSEARLLADEARLSLVAGRPLLTLRMWIA
jgi:hypothetical protein